MKGQRGAQNGKKGARHAYGRPLNVRSRTESRAFAVGADGLKLIRFPRSPARTSSLYLLCRSSRSLHCTHKWPQAMEFRSRGWGRQKGETRNT